MTDPGPAPGLPAPDTVTEAMELLAAEGYTASFDMVDGDLRCLPCGHRHPAEGALVERFVRFEGESDPDDEAIVLGLRCPTCGARGIMVSGYGPSADPNELDILKVLYRKAPH